MSTPAVSTDAVRAELARIVASQTFAGAKRSAQLLEYVVGETLAGRGAYLKEYSLGADALARGPTFDPAPIRSRASSARLASGSSCTTPRRAAAPRL